MEERVWQPPPPNEDADNNSHNTKSQLVDIKPGTYVVQVPKDQVYRVPPPENAAIAESHRKAPPKKTNSSCCLCCVLFITIFIILLIFLGGVMGFLFSMFIKPKNPEFSVKRFQVSESKPRAKYNVTVEVLNANSDVGISYEDRGRVSLSLKRKEIASGDYATFHQEPHDKKTFGVTLKSLKTGLPKEVEKSVTNDKEKVPVTFSLAIEVQARMKMGLLRSGTMKFDVTCTLKLDSLAKNTRVLSQQCQTKRH